MKLYLQILIIGILVFSSKQQYTCSISGSGRYDGFYNAPTGAGGICTNTGVCKRQFSENAGTSASKGTLTGDCFHCNRPDRFLDRGQSVQGVRCYRFCKTGYTDSSAGADYSSPLLQGNCKYCISGLQNRNGACECQNKDLFIINTYSRTCGTKCEEGYVQYRDGVHLPKQFTHCVYCHYGLENQNGVCACAINGQYLIKPGYSECGYVCETNFTHYSDGSAPASPITGNCFHCITGHTLYNRKCSPICPPGQYYINFNPICGTTCSSGYSDYWSAFGSNPIQDHCSHCQKGLVLFSNTGCTCRFGGTYLTSTNSEKCGTTCISGYTHKSDGSAPNSPINGHCSFCISDTHTMFLGQCYRYCQSGYYHSQNGICGTTCTFGYTDNEDGSNPSSPIEGDCQYCISGLVKKNYVCECSISGEYFTSSNSRTCGATCQNGYTDQQNGGTPAQPLTGHCLYERLCTNGLYFTQIDGNCGQGTCVPGYTDQEDGSTASEFISSDCQYCLKGLINDGTCYCENPIEFLMSISGGKCGTSCAYGYTHFSYGSPSLTPSVGHCLYCESGFTKIGDECI